MILLKEQMNLEFTIGFTLGFTPTPSFINESDLKEK